MEYRDIAPIMGRLWSPLAAVTTRWQGNANAQIAVAISAASIVPDRPRVLVQIYKGNYSHQLIRRSGAFALNFLSEKELYYIRDFGLVSGKERDKLASVDYTEGITGCPILKASAGFLECRVINAMDGGDMTCFLADVVDGGASSGAASGTTPGASPLTWREARRLIPPEWNEAWEARIGAEIEVSRQRMGRLDYAPWPWPDTDGQTGKETRRNQYGSRN